MNNIQLVKRKFERSAGTYDAHAHAQKQAVCKLFKIIAQTFTWQPEQILEIGCGTGLLTKQINTQYYPKQYFLNDINERVKDILPQLMPYKEYEFLYGDAQQIVLPKGNDLVVSASSVQWFDDLPKFFEKIKQSMTVDGYMFFSTFGPSNLQEITALENQGLHYYTLQELKQILQTQFELITCDEECIKLSFEDPLAVLKHLKYTGVNGGFSTVWNKTKLKNFCRAYTEQFSEEKGVTLTYHPIYFAVKKQMTNKQVYFVTGIDTDIGKSYATGFIAKTMAECGEKVITQKFIQTGNTDISEDIQLHRKIMGLELQPVDKEGVTCPIVFTYPASPHLSAKIDNREIDLKKVNQATQTLHKTYDIVLIEGAGGVMVPISQEFLTIDYVAAERLSVILVTTPRLGSISHTLLTLDACKNRSIPVHMLAYNEFRVDDNVISQDTKVYLKQYLAQHFPQTQWLDVPKINVSANHLNSVA